MPINEPRIYTNTPKWVGLEEIETKNGFVWFKTKTGKISVSVKEVDNWNNRSKRNGSRLSKHPS